MVFLPRIQGAFALFAGIVASLKSLLSDEDTTVRQKSTECLFVIAGEKNSMTSKWTKADSLYTHIPSALVSTV